MTWTWTRPPDTLIDHRSTPGEEKTPEALYYMRHMQSAERLMNFDQVGILHLDRYHWEHR